MVSSAGPGPPLGRAEPEAGGAQPPHQLTALDLDRARIEHRRAVLLGDVVVVALEGPPGDADAQGEGVQLVERGVAHHVAPPAAAVPPARFVDQHGHSGSLPARDCRGER